ncbi:hypothetical protein [Bacillus sp. FJAT-27225]|uniref:hypothetical protein n=1 Tax=Bacillus sp. FJAT-27225 TaxID=1743144 RepID=UPI0009816918|nr:hypothetical protein [Bacillus sp. FJAT-27225]
MKLLTRFRNSCETSEGHQDADLRTHYYRANKDALFLTIEGILKKRKGTVITDSSKERGEIAADLSEPFNSFLIATIVTVRPFETAVDFHLSTERFMLLGNYPALKKEILDFYKELDKAHTYTGAGKNAE